MVYLNKINTKIKIPSPLQKFIYINLNIFRRKKKQRDFVALYQIKLLFILRIFKNSANYSLDYIP